MKKRIIALVLCVFMLVPVFSSCSGGVVESIMQVYLSQQVYDLDPLYAMNNDAQLKIVSLIFSGLYKLDSNGNVVDDLAAKTEVINDIVKEEYTVRITLKNTYWSDGSAVSSDDVVYTMKRVLKAQNSNDATAILLKIKNAAAVKSGEASIDDLGVTAPETNVIEISFDKEITNELLGELKLSFTSPALFPLREGYVQGKPDWAKKPSSMVCSGPFILRRASYEEGSGQFILERNEYYMRDREKDAEDKYVTPYRIVIDFGVSPEEQLDLYNNGQVVFVNDIPLSLRSEYASKVSVVDTLSTHTYYFNQNASVYNKGYREEVTEYFTQLYSNDDGSTYKKYVSAETAWKTWSKNNAEDVTLPFPTMPEAPSPISLPSIDVNDFSEKNIVYYTDEDIAAFKLAVEEYNKAVAEFNAEYEIMRFAESAKPPVIPSVPAPKKEAKLFANDKVRAALSLVIDRTEIANEIVFAKPATGLLNEKMFYGTTAGKTFRSQGDAISAAANKTEAESLLAASGINPSDYSFSIRYRASDEVHTAIAKAVAAAWAGLGFDVVLEPIGVIVNDDMDPSTKEYVTDIRDDIFNEEIVVGNNYQVMAIDLVANTPDAFSVLAPFAIGYTGNKTVDGVLKSEGEHETGYNSDEYNDLIDRAFKATNVDERAALLLDAEKLLVAKDAAVVPIVFNRTATLIGSKLDARSISQSYTGCWIFTKANLKGWSEYRDMYFPETTEEEAPEVSPSDEATN